MLQAMSPTLMGIALHSFDDQYLGCREEMMGEPEQGHYFKKEIAANKHCLHLWKKAQEALLKSPVGDQREMHDSHALHHELLLPLAAELDYIFSRNLSRAL